jgi:uncharacterized protein (TIGR02284 family)
METQNEKLTSVLNELVKINNDRIVGYQKAAEETEDTALKVVFNKMAGDSRQYHEELSNEIVRLQGRVTTDTTLSGKFYRVWMDIKAAVAGRDRTAILDSCEFGEDAAQEAYQLALESDAEIPADTRQLIVNQKTSLKTAHDAIKKMRDVSKGM